MRDHCCSTKRIVRSVWGWVLIIFSFISSALHGLYMALLVYSALKWSNTTELSQWDLSDVSFCRQNLTGCSPIGCGVPDATGGEQISETAHSAHNPRLSSRWEVWEMSRFSLSLDIRPSDQKYWDWLRRMAQEHRLLPFWRLCVQLLSMVECRGIDHSVLYFAVSTLAGLEEEGLEEINVSWQFFSLVLCCRT